jgi:hypothetical protein
MEKVEYFWFNKEKITYLEDTRFNPKGERMNKKMHIYITKDKKKLYFSSGNIPYYMSLEKQH